MGQWVAWEVQGHFPPASCFPPPLLLSPWSSAPVWATCMLQSLKGTCSHDCIPSRVSTVSPLPLSQTYLQQRCYAAPSPLTLPLAHNRPFTMVPELARTVTSWGQPMAPSGPGYNIASHALLPHTKSHLGAEDRGLADPSCPTPGRQKGLATR